MTKSSGFLLPRAVFYPVVVVLEPFVVMDETSPKSSSSIYIICITLFANTEYGTLLTCPSLWLTLFD